MIHISQLPKARVEKVGDVIKVGDAVTVRVRRIEPNARSYQPHPARCVPGTRGA